MDLKLLQEIDQKSKLLVVERTIGAYENKLLKAGRDLNHPILEKVIKEYRDYLLNEIDRGDTEWNLDFTDSLEQKKGTADHYKSNDLEGTGAPTLGLNTRKGRPLTPKDVEKGNVVVNITGDDFSFKEWISPTRIKVGDPRHTMSDTEVDIESLDGPTPGKNGYLIWTQNPALAADKDRGQMMPQRR